MEVLKVIITLTRKGNKISASGHATDLATDVGVSQDILENFMLDFQPSFHPSSFVINESFLNPPHGLTPASTSFLLHLKTKPFSFLGMGISGFVLVATKNSSQCLDLR